MNKLQTNFRNEQQSIKRLFKELFLIQIELEKFTEQGFHPHETTSDLIRTIDQILEILMILSESLES